MINNALLDEMFLKLNSEEYISKNTDVFKNDLFEALGIEDNPKKDILYAKAYELGHSSGYCEILNVSLELLELIE